MIIVGDMNMLLVAFMCIHNRVNSCIIITDLVPTAVAMLHMHANPSCHVECCCVTGTCK